MLKKRYFVTDHAVIRFMEVVSNELSVNDVKKFIEKKIQESIPHYFIHWNNAILPCYIIKYYTLKGHEVEFYAPLSTTSDKLGNIYDCVPTVLPIDYNLKIRYVVKRRK